MSFEHYTDKELQLLSSGQRVRMPGDHQSLFKYVSLNTKTSWSYLERALNESELMGSTPTALNDPFELAPRRFDDLNNDTIAKAIRYVDNSDLLDDEPNTKKTNIFEIDDYRNRAKKLLDNTVKNSRVIAFSDRSDSPLLWSHYAHSYSGACLHFFGKAFHRHDLRLGFVDYSEHRPIYPLSLAIATNHAQNNVRSDFRFPMLKAESDRIIFFTKALEWAYEREFRIVYNYRKQKSLQFKLGGLASIIIGPKMENENRERLKRLLKTSMYKTIPVQQAKLSRNTFSVETLG